MACNNPYASRAVMASGGSAAVGDSAASGGLAASGSIGAARDSRGPTLRIANANTP